MKSYGTLIVLGIMLNSQAYANNLAQVKPNHATKNKRSPLLAKSDKPLSVGMRKTGASSEESTSSDIRQTKSFGIAAKYGSPGAGVIMPGGEVLGIVNRTFQLNLSFFNTSQNLAGSFPDSSDGNVNLQTEGVNFAANAAILGGRYFFGNSFFMGGGIGYRTYELKYLFNAQVQNTASLAASSGEVGSEIQAESLYATFGIGNQWLFENGFFITGEWIGYAVPLSSSYRYKKTINGVFQDNVDINTVLDDGAKSIGSTMAKSAQVTSMISFGWAL